MVKKGKRYLSLNSGEGRILHIHHTGSAIGEIHLDKKFWGKFINIKELIKILKNSYEVRDLGQDIRIVRLDKKAFANMNPAEKKASLAGRASVLAKTKKAYARDCSRKKKK